MFEEIAAPNHDNEEHGAWPACIHHPWPVFESSRTLFQGCHQRNMQVAPRPMPSEPLSL
jgi:hypothetical protein